MNTRNASRCVTPAKALAVLTVLGLAWSSTPPASAQLGRLVVTMTSPTSGSTVGGTITVSADVTLIGLLTVRGVQFKLDGANLGAEDTSGPYSIPWDTRTASNASHTLTAVARDQLGVQWTSDPVTLTVFNDKTPPTVSITSPSPGAAVRATISLGAAASDNVGVVGVQFKLDGANFEAEDTTSPYSVSWNTTTASNGSHTVSAVARDAAGNTATSSAINVTVDNLPPSVTINQAAGQVDPTNTSPINFTVVFSEAVSGFGAAAVTLGGTAGGTKTVTGGPSTYNVAVSGMTSGTVIATIAAGVVTDAAGNGNTASTSTDNTVTFNNTPPAVTVTSPSSGATVSGTLPVTASASDDIGVVGVQFKLDGANLAGEATTSPYSVSWNTTTASNGSHTLTAVARDAAGNTTTSSGVTVTVDNVAPTVTINQAAGQMDPTNASPISFTVVFSEAVSGFTSADVTISGTAGGTKTVTVTGGPSTYTVAVGGMTSGTVVANVPAGVATDAAGNLSTASTGADNVVTFDSAAPTVTIDQAAGQMDPTNASPISFTVVFSEAVSGFTAAGVTISGTAGGTKTVAVTGGPSTYNVAVSGMTSGSVIAAVAAGAAHDGAGNANTASTSTDNTVSFDATPPTVAVTSPASGATVSGTLPVTADASDNVGVTGVRFLVDGAALGAEVTTAPYSTSWDTTTVTAGSHSLTAVARDAAGNTTTSAAVTVTVSNTPTTTSVTRFEDMDPAIIYTDGVTAPGQPAGWWHGSRSRAWSGKTASFNRSQGAKARFSFTGTTVRWIGFLAPWAGIARVYVDDVFVTELDLYTPAEQVQTVVFSRTDLTYGTHSLTVESTGRKNASSSDYAVVVDAFEVAPASPPTTTGTRVEETGLSLSPGWTSDSQNTRAWSGGTAAVSATTGAQATLSFLGTEVRWIGLRGPQNGIATVYLDGSFQATVDTYAPVEIQGLVFTATTLTPGRHTLTINVTGTSKPASTGVAIVVDALDVRSRIEDADSSVTYTADWRQNNFDKAWSGASPNTGTGSAALSRTAGGQATLTFSGTGVSWIGSREPRTGIARVLVDGAYLADVDTYAATEQLQAPLYSVTGLSDGSHTLTIEATGQHNAASIDSLIIVDAFDLTLSPSAPTITRFQERDPSVTYSGTWTQGTVFSYWSGETAAYDGTAGDQVTFSFTGTAVRWISQYGFNNGIANILLDGVQVAQIDTFASVQEQDQVPIFIATGLANTTHTLTIQVTGQKNPSAFNPWILVDAFDVY